MEYTLNQNCESGLQYLLAADNQNGPAVMDLFGDGNDSVRMHMNNWGVYEVLYSEAFRANKNVKKVILAAYVADLVHQSSLYLTDSKNPLYLAGDAKLEGTVYLPASGVRAGSANNTGYTGGKLLQGTRKQSAGMPELRQGLSDNLKNILEMHDVESMLIVDQLGDSLSHSFYSDKPALFQSNKTIELNAVLDGMIVIYSSEKIIIQSKAKLNHVLVVAPEVQVEAGFAGSVQIIASDKIMLGDSVQLTYPSSLVLIPLGKECKIELATGATVSGDILIEKDGTSEKEGILVMKPKTIFEGFAHIDGSVEILGTIKGHLSCKKFEWNSGSEVFGNHLKDAELNYSKKQSWLTSSGLWKGNSRASLLKLK